MTEKINELPPVALVALDYGDRLQEIAFILLAGGFAVFAGLGIILALRLVLTWLWASLLLLQSPEALTR